ncbi:hypothetical protein PIB30_070396 [Stylosanthes scabra]|uniref:FAR1 domain-containing protein n=1 Tax=Stylosanthes scabra TaxID=79078 RepID=A0ABU6SNM2_9FABA|nr:hypothetical protein [Stylosanthes scabra]
MGKIGLNKEGCSSSKYAIVTWLIEVRKERRRGRRKSRGRRLAESGLKPFPSEAIRSIANLGQGWLSETVNWVGKTVWECEFGGDDLCLVFQVEAMTEGSFAPSRNEFQEPDSKGEHDSIGSAVDGMGSSEVGSFSDEDEQEQSVRVVDGIGDFDSIDFSSLMEEEVLRFEFPNLQAAYEFYNQYGRVKSFSVRRSKMGRRKKAGATGEIMWQIFVCSCEGEREGKYM